jgi:hypothetical protein
MVGEDEAAMVYRARFSILAVFVAILAFAPAAQAQHHRHGHHGGHHGGSGVGAAIAGGLIGLGLGAAIAGASQAPPYYAPPPVYYPPAYYPPAPAYQAYAGYAAALGDKSAASLNRQELNRLRAFPYYY